MFTLTDLLVGVDVHRRTNVVQVMDGQGQVLTPPLRLANNRAGTAELSARLAEIAQTGHFNAIYIAAEATGNFFLPIGTIARPNGLSPDALSL